MVNETNTKAEILDYVKVLEDTLAEQTEHDAQDTAVPDELDRDRPTATMPDKIVAWLKISLGKDVDPETIMVQDVTATSVVYRFKGEKNIFGIPLTSEGVLKDPPRHEHAWVRRGGPGGAELCLCGKRLSPDGYAMSVEEQRAMAQGESAAKAGVEEDQESAQLEDEEDIDPDLNE